jgi:hypothetical protein
MAARQTVALLELLHAGKLASRVDTAEMLTWLDNANDPKHIGKYLVPGVTLANKYGGSRRIAADVGIVANLPGGNGQYGAGAQPATVIIAGFTLAGAKDAAGGRLPDAAIGDLKVEAIQVMAEMARLFLSTIDPTAVLPVEQ